MQSVPSIKEILSTLEWHAPNRKVVCPAEDVDGIRKLAAEYGKATFTEVVVGQALPDGMVLVMEWPRD